MHHWQMRCVSFFFAIISMVIANPAEATTRSGATLSDQETARIVSAVETVVRKDYVFPDKVDAITARLQAAHASGRYAALNAAALADRITSDLEAASDDGHLYLRLDSVQYAAASRDAQAGSSGEQEDIEAYERRLAVRDHHGLTDMRILPGNLRYLRISGFEWVQDETGTVYDAAMGFLRDGDAAIIDLRGNGGGSHAAVRYLVSHFLDGDVLLFDFTERGAPTVQSRTLEHVPAGRLKGHLLYVLIDGGSASAAEDFAYQVQQFRLGHLVGERSAGAANNNKLVPIADGLMLSVSSGRPVHAISHGNWEGSGIAPDIEAPTAQALDIAQQSALAVLDAGPRVDAARHSEYRWARIGTEAKLHPVTIAPQHLHALAGRYGDIEISIRDHALWIARPDRPVRRLDPLDDDGRFAVDGSDTLRARFVADGLEIWRVGDPDPVVHLRQ